MNARVQWVDGSLGQVRSIPRLTSAATRMTQPGVYVPVQTPASPPRYVPFQPAEPAPPAPPAPPPSQISEERITVRVGDQTFSGMTNSLEIDQVFHYLQKFPQQPPGNQWMQDNAYYQGDAYQLTQVEVRPHGGSSWWRGRIPLVNTRQVLALVGLYTEERDPVKNLSGSSVGQQGDVGQYRALPVRLAPVSTRAETLPQFFEVIVYVGNRVRARGYGTWPNILRAANYLGQHIDGGSDQAMRPAVYQLFSTEAKLPEVRRLIGLAPYLASIPTCPRHQILDRSGRCVARVSGLRGSARVQWLGDSLGAPEVPLESGATYRFLYAVPGDCSAIADADVAASLTPVGWTNVAVRSKDQATGACRVLVEQTFGGTSQPIDVGSNPFVPPLESRGASTQQVVNVGTGLTIFDAATGVTPPQTPRCRPDQSLVNNVCVDLCTPDKRWNPATTQCEPRLGPPPPPVCSADQVLQNGVCVPKGSGGTEGMRARRKSNTGLIVAGGLVATGLIAFAISRRS